MSMAVTMAAFQVSLAIIYGAWMICRSIEPSSKRPTTNQNSRSEEQ